MQPSAFFPQVSASRVLDSKSSAASTAVCDYQSSSPGTPYGTGQFSTQLQGSRGFRFPSSRRFLWDRTPAGAQLLINTEDQKPHVQIAASGFNALKRAAEQKSRTAALQLGLSVTATCQVTAVVQELDPLVAQTSADLLHLPCPLLSASQHEEASSYTRLQEMFAAQLDQRNTATVQQLYAVCAAAEAAGSPAERFTLQLELLMPCCSFLATPLYTKRLCNVPLAEALLKPGKLQSPQTGYLSMDQARSLLPLEATNVNVYTTPLVGVWVKGPSSALHPLVAAACMRFVYSSLLADRAVNPDNGAFLLLLCPEGDPMSKCFEVTPSEPQHLKLASYQLHASFSPMAGMAQFTNGGFMTSEWVLSQQQPQPMPGHLKAPAAGTAGAASGASRAVGKPAQAGSRVLALPSPGGAVAASSPVVLGPKLGGYCAATATRSSAPDLRPGAGREQQQHYTAAAARRSLPLSGAAQMGARTTAMDVGSQLVSYNGNSWEGSETAESEPRASFHARPYGSPPLQCWTAAGQRTVETSQQQNGDQEQQQQEWVQLGEQLLVEPSAAGLHQQQLRIETCQQHPAGHVGQHLQDSSVAAYGGTTPASLPESWTYLEQQQQRPGHHTGSLAGGMQPPDSANVSGESSFQVHALRPVSPSVQAGLALSNLALLQQLSTGQLEQAIDRVKSPSNSRCSSPASHLTPAAAAAICERPLAGANSVVGAAGAAQCRSSAVSSSQSAAVGVDKAAWLTLAKPQTPDSYGTSTLGTSVLFGSPRTGPNVHHVPPDSSVDALRAAAATSPLRSSTDPVGSAAVAANAALQAATAAVRAISPNPYPKSMGVNRYAADAAVITSQEYSKAGLASLAGSTSTKTAATAGGGGGARSSTSTALVPAAHQSATSSSSSMGYGVNALGQICRTDQWDAGLHEATALDAAGQMMDVYNSADAVVGYQQIMPQQLELLPTVWNDPVAQELQQEVERLRQELQHLRQHLRSAGMPRLEALALPPLEESAPIEPVLAPDILPAASAAQEVAMHNEQAIQHTAQQLQQNQQLWLQAVEQQTSGSSVARTDSTSTAGAGSAAHAAGDDVAPGVNGPSAAARHDQRPTDNRHAQQAGVAAGQVSGPPISAPPWPQATMGASMAVAQASFTINTCDNQHVQRTAATSQQQEQQQQAPSVSQHRPLHPAVVVPIIQQDRQLQECQQQQQHNQQHVHGEQQIADDSPQQLPVPEPATSPKHQEQRSNHCTHSGGSADGEQDDSSSHGRRHQSINAAPAISTENSRDDSSSDTGTPRKALKRRSAAAAHLSSPIAAISPAMLRDSGAKRVSCGSSVRGSAASGVVRSSLEVPPLVEVVRTKYCALEDDSEDSDREFEERLMLKYGMKH